MSASDHARFSEDVGAYLLGALPDDEREGFERHLAACAQCRREVEELGVAADTLPAAAPPVSPPPELKRRIMAVVDAEAALLAAAGGDADRAPAVAPLEGGLRRFLRRGFTLRPAFALGAAVVLVALGAVGGVLAGGGDESARTVTGQVAGPAAHAQAELVVGDGGARLVARDFPQPPAGRVYQVWKQRPGRNPEPTDVLWTPLADGSATVSVPGSLDGVEAVLVSAERRGGSAAPTSMPLVVASLG